MIPLYELIINSEEQGIVGISLVEDPAIGEHFIMLSNEDVDMHTIMSNDEQQVLMGPVLIPNLPINRIDGAGNPYQIIFSKAKILELARNMMRNGSHQVIDKEHDQHRLHSIATQELWIVEDNDKAYNYFDKKQIPVGTLMAAVHVPSKQTWSEIKRSKLSGFSIDAITGLRSIFSDIDKQVSGGNDAVKEKGEQEIVDLIKNIITSDETEDMKIGRVKQVLNM